MKLKGGERETNMKHDIKAWCFNSAQAHDPYKIALLTHSSIFTFRLFFFPPQMRVFSFSLFLSVSPVLWRSPPLPLRSLSLAEFGQDVDCSPCLAVPTPRCPHRCPRSAPVHCPRTETEWILQCRYIHTGVILYCKEFICVWHILLFCEMKSKILISARTKHQNQSRSWKEHKFIIRIICMSTQHLLL